MEPPEESSGPGIGAFVPTGAGRRVNVAPPSALTYVPYPAPVS